MNPDVARILEHFAFAHLPPHLRTVSQPVGELAREMAAQLDGPELLAGLRKLLEAKDCLVRAALEAHRASKAG
jgi:hypothetical protein